MKIYHYSAELTDKDTKIIDTGVISHESLESMRTMLKSNIDMYIDKLICETSGHLCTRGFIVHPLIHIVHDDQNINNEDYINLRIRELDETLKKIGI